MTGLPFRLRAADVRGSIPRPSVQVSPSDVRRVVWRWSSTGLQEIQACGGGLSDLIGASPSLTAPSRRDRQREKDGSGRGGRLGDDGEAREDDVKLLVAK